MEIARRHTRFSIPPVTPSLVPLSSSGRTAGAVATILFLASACSAGFHQRTAAEVLSDSRYAWLTDSTAHTRVHYLAGTLAADSITQFKRSVERAWQVAATFVSDTAPTHIIDVFAVPRREMVTEAANLTGVGPATGINFWKTRVVITWASTAAAMSPHEFVHVMTYDAWGPVSEWWLGEGAATAASRWNGVDLDAYAKCLSDAGKLLSADELVAMHSSNLKAQAVAYPEAGSFDRFLISQYGREKFARLYGRGASALREIYGKSLLELDADWRRHLATVDAGTTKCG